MFFPVYAMGSNLSYDLNTSNLPIHDNSINTPINHTHSNTTENSSNLSAHVHADQTLTATFIQNNTAEGVTVALEDYKKNNPSTTPLPGLSIRFFKINTQNISYKSIIVNVAYCEMELNGTDEGHLAVFRYETNSSTWTMLPTEVNREDNTLRASMDSLSLFAVSSHSENTTAHTHNDTSRMEDSIPHNCTEMNDRSLSASFIAPEKVEITLEVESENSSDSSLPGYPIKFFRIGARNLSYSRVDVEVVYSDAVLNGTNESNLSISHYTNSTWVMIPTEILEDKNTLKASVESLSLFAISTTSGTGTGMSMGTISDCLRCHGSSNTASDGGVMEEMGGMGGMGESVPKVDISIMNLSIHSNLNNASSNLNQACWACHSNSTTPPTRHPPMHRASALDCSACHLSGIGKFSPPRTTEHTTHAVNITVNATCQLCHGKSEMVNLNGSTVNSTISHYGKNRIDLVDLNKTGTNCSYCHQNPASEFSDVFNNASRINITHNGNLNCSSCHGTGRLHDSNLMNMEGYKLSDCTQCHGTGGFALNKVSESAINQSIHANLNSADISLNRACWTCHSNLTAAPQAHPDIAEPPNACSTCHIDENLNLTKKLKPNHLTQHIPQGSQIKVPVACTFCHSNDAIASGKTINSTVSHYGEYPGVETKDCVSCHLNEDIGRRWGSPPDPRDTISLARVEKKLVSDEIWRLNQNYSIAVSGIDKEGQSAWLELYYNGKLIRKDLVPEGGSFKYDAKIEQSSFNKTFIDLRIADIFYGGNVSLISFSGIVPRRTHTETSSIQCYACHVKDYRPDKPDGYRYFVLKKENQNVTLNKLDIDFTSTDKKAMSSNESWDLGSGYELSIKDFSPNRDYVWLVLAKDGNIVKEDFVREGEYFTYNATLNGIDITMFRLKIANLFVKG
ncbi:S-layer protein domain-containing protein [Candidatus Methanoperedens nitratireducens]|nr:S-layer protein domain-containing protein [Candidatus Methanoperedens nitroreducens]